MNRYGFHYFPDTQHYRKQDLDFWLPRLESLGTRWLVLMAPINRTIPEEFIKALIYANIQPVLQFHALIDNVLTLDDLNLLFNIYKRWGVQYATLFDQPNMHNIWKASSWSQADLVERFLDNYLPLANACLKASLTPIFPPLKPGGDYWDTAFLRRALHSLRRRRQHHLLDQLVIGAYSSPGEHPIQWGAGGPERWPNARPYFTPPGVEDQRGFRIFDWYIAITQAVLSSSLPIFLFGMGYSSNNEENVNRNLTITRLLSGEFIEGYEPIPTEVIGGAFHPLVDLYDRTIQGWYSQNGEPHSQADTIRKIVKSASSGTQNSQKESQSIHVHHYLLLPSYEWGVSDYHLDIIRPIIKKYQPTIGFSILEAQNAERVTVIGGEEAFSESSLNKLRANGIHVRRIDLHGTDIASILSTFQ